MADIRVFVAGGDRLARLAIRSILAREPGITVVGEAAVAREVPGLCHNLSADLLLLDASMAGWHAVDLMPRLLVQCASVKVLAVRSEDVGAWLQPPLALGIAGFMLKDEAPEALARAIRIVARGGRWFGQPRADSIGQGAAGSGCTTGLYDLTPREWQVLGLIVNGWDNAHIAQELGLSVQTVRNYASRVYCKLGVRSRAEAIVWALKKG